MHGTPCARGVPAAGLIIIIIYNNPSKPAARLVLHLAGSYFILQLIRGAPRTGNRNMEIAGNPSSARFVEINVSVYMTYNGPEYSITLRYKVGHYVHTVYCLI